MRNQSAESEKGQKLIDMISTDCDLMVKMIMFGIERKQSTSDSRNGRPRDEHLRKASSVNGSRLFSAVMKAADIDLFSEIFKD